MILRRYALRHGRQAVTTPFKRSCLRALSTDNQQPPRYSSLSTKDGIPGTPPDSPAGSIPPSPAVDDKPSSLKTIWARQRRVKLDKSIMRDFDCFTRVDSTTGELGSKVTSRFNPSIILQNPPGPEDVTLELLMSSQTHMGHHTSLWNPANQRYIYGVRSGIHIISLEETAAALRRAAKVVEEVAYLGGLILFVGNRKGQMEITARAAELAGACHLFTKWVPGTITNRDQILGKEVLRIVDEKDEPMEGFEKYLLEARPVMPDLVVVLNPLENFPLLHECSQESIPTIGLIDTDADPTRVTYTIPGNDDSLRSVAVIASVLGRAGERGQQRRKADAARGVSTWDNSTDMETWLLEERERKIEELEEQANEERMAGEGNEDAAEDDNTGAVDRNELNRMLPGLDRV